MFRYATVYIDYKYLITLTSFSMIGAIFPQASRQIPSLRPPSPFLGELASLTWIHCKLAEERLWNALHHGKYRSCLTRSSFSQEHRAFYLHEKHCPLY